MAVSIQVNASDFLNGMQTFEDKVHDAVAVGILRAGTAIERKAVMNFQGTRSYEKRVSKKTGRPWLKITPQRHVGGEGPNTVTGNLKRSIRTDVKYGFGTYVAVVGASMIYARAVEQGLPQNPNVKYPYLAPAAKTLAQNGTLNRVFATAIKEKLGV
mgnify:CR=1 FL=1